MAQQAASLGVCTNRACRKTSSAEVLTMLRMLASTRGGNIIAGETGADLTAIKVQEKFGKARVEKTGCLGKCGAGPNVVNMASGEVHRGVWRTSDAVAVLEAIGLEIPIAASLAYTK